MGTTRQRTAAAVTTTIAVAGLLGLGLAGCAGGDDDAAQPATGEAAAATVAGDDGRQLTEAVAPAAAAPDAASGGSETASQAPGAATDVATAQVPGQQLAISAHATLETDDVRAAVSRITSTVTTRGGRVASADIDYADPGADPDDDSTSGSRATLVLEVPPGELQGVAGALEDIGTVLSFDQLAEDVTKQLADLDTRIANMRASVERVRALYAQASDIDSVVRLEAELTRRETDLEVLLASQQALEDRVAMATLTVDVATSADALATGDDDTGIGDALAAGWGAFVGGLFAVILVLAAIAPFVLTGLVLASLVLWIRHLLVRQRPPAGRAGPPAPPPAGDAVPEPERAATP